MGEGHRDSKRKRERERKTERGRVSKTVSTLLIISKLIKAHGTKAN